MLIPPPPGALGILLPHMYPPVKSVCVWGGPPHCAVAAVEIVWPSVWEVADQCPPPDTLERPAAGCSASLTFVKCSFPPEPRVQMIRCLEKRKHCLSPSFLRDREPSRPRVTFPFSDIGTWMRDPAGEEALPSQPLAPGTPAPLQQRIKTADQGGSLGWGPCAAQTPAQGLPEGVCRGGAEKNGTENLPGLPGWQQQQQQQHQAGFLSEESYSIPNVALGSLFPVTHPFKVIGGHGYRQPMKGTGPFLDGRGSFSTLITLVLNLPALNFSGPALELSEKEELLSPPPQGSLRGCPFLEDLQLLGLEARRLVGYLVSRRSGWCPGGFRSLQ